MSFFLRPRRALLSLTPNTSRLPRHHFFSSTCHARQEVAGERTEENLEAEAEEEDQFANTATYEDWIYSEGVKWRYPDSLGPKWLGGKVPFPNNLTFKPPIPLSDLLRTTIYKSYTSNPTTNNYHALSTQYGISVKRIEAIIRLKTLEDQWIKVRVISHFFKLIPSPFMSYADFLNDVLLAKESKPLQTGFLEGMERLLAIRPGGREQSVPEEISSPRRDDVNEADELSQQSSAQGNRKRGLSRTFFETVDEGQEAVVPHLLDEHRETAVGGRAKRPEYPTIVVQPDPTKPAYKFVDVGLRWIDRKDMERRQKEGTRRKIVKAGKKAKAAAIAALSS